MSQAELEPVWRGAVPIIYVHSSVKDELWTVERLRMCLCGPNRYPSQLLGPGLVHLCFDPGHVVPQKGIPPSSGKISLAVMASDLVPHF